MRKMIFFGSLFVDKRSRKVSATKIAESFLDETPAKNLPGHLCDPCEAEAAVCEVHALPSSAAVERLLSTGTDVLRPKKRDYQTSISKC